MNPEIFEKAHAVIKARRMRAISENDRRIDEVNSEIPQIMEINKQLFNTSRKLISVIGAGQPKDIVYRKIQQIRRENLEAQALLRQKLIENGKRSDYLDIHYTCSKCNDTGYYKNAMCDCFNKLCRELSAKEMNRHSQLALSSFDTFRLSYYTGDDYYTMKEHLEYLERYAENFSLQSNSILISGDTGLGKTHLSLAVANKVLEKGYSVIYDSTINILQEMEKEHFSYNSSLEKTELVLQSDLLILDDLGTEYRKPFYTSTIYNIINTRLNRNKPTIISTNLDYEEISLRYESRIVSRLSTVYAHLRFSGEDVRLLKKAEKKQRY
ncbi:MAG: ATP-binding protein [Ruminococcus sp.]|nr:ATP-binding protein [Ruminococcus sp.]